ncbi:recombination endonuclease VII [Pseudomonas phage Achelous]|uniref:Recombination endonuclease VII n=1 Tax=Pseudomonas phage Achelous TaxID=2163982 RepID=A0A2S1GMT4_9CAUD|nr:endonuclease VII [Pseudomonas phage Achelous]AWD90697.1 recombination endonuclease VII [Pseudomonas phage Achelous]
MDRVKTKASDLPRIKAELIAKQNGLCPITGRSLRGMTSSNVVVDHNHQTGIIRAALPRGVNGLEGKLRNLCIRWGGCKTQREIIDLLKGLVAYYELHGTPQTPYVHHTFLTPTEERNKRNAAARKKAAASRAS